MTATMPQTDDDWERLCNTLASLPVLGTEGMSVGERRDGTRTMLGDLKQLADRDGCIAAGWALGLAVAAARFRTADEPLADEWLLRAGFVEAQKGILTLGGKQAENLLMRVNGRWFVRGQHVPADIAPETREDVRRLAARVGATLREGV